MKPLDHFDAIILGAGASGLMCGANLPKHLRILILEKSSKIGSKILISGGGKCNIVNEDVSEEDFLADGIFLQPLLHQVEPKDILSFFEDVKFERRKKGQIFTKYGSKEVLKVLKQKASHCNIELNTEVLKVEHKGHFVCKSTKGTFTSDKLIVATGGLSYPSLGGSGIGYEIAKDFGHEISEPSPALVGLSLQKEQFWMKELSGISVKVSIKVGKKSFTDELLFSHRGISGPAILNASLFWKKGQVELDFLPETKLNKLLKGQSKKQISSLLPLPKRFNKAFLAHLGVEDRAVCKLSKDELSKLQNFHSYTFAPAGNFGYAKAEVSRGGVKTEAIDPLTYESKKRQGLYFLGEVLDVTGRLGGYNFYFAFGSALMNVRGW